jgi:hypothetical protein
LNLFLAKKSENSNIDTYRTGYVNGLSDIFEYLDNYPDNDQLLIDLTQFFKEKESELKDLIGKT